MMGDRILAPFQYNGTMDSRLFEFWFSNQLLPSLEQGTVIVMDNTSDPWLESARAQIIRLDKLIKNLVELARTEENIREDAAVSFSISEVARAGADAFQPLAEADGKTLTAEIEDGITLKGVQDNFSACFQFCWTTRSNTVTPAGPSAWRYPNGDGISISRSPIPARGWTPPSSPA